MKHHYVPFFCPMLAGGQGADSQQKEPVECPYGFACVFAHTKDEVLFHPDIFKTILCKEFEETGECHRFYCPFGHGIEELRGSPLPPHLRMQCVEAVNCGHSAETQDEGICCQICETRVALEGLTVNARKTAVEILQQVPAGKRAGAAPQPEPMPAQAIEQPRHPVELARLVGSGHRAIAPPGGCSGGDACMQCAANIANAVRSMAPPPARSLPPNIPFPREVPVQEFIEDAYDLPRYETLVVRDGVRWYGGLLQLPESAPHFGCGEPR